MTVDQLLAKLADAFPAFNAKALAAWANVFRSTLSRHEGPALAQAFTDTLAGFTVAKSKALFPVPADFVERLPGNVKMPTEGGPKLDFRTRGERARSLMREWREGQGLRAAGNNPAIMRALEHMVEPLANLWGWSEAPKPIRLKIKQVRIVQQRAISQERVRLHGPLGINPNGAVWWSQIEAICNEWGIPAVYDEWAAKKLKEAA